uniref:Uncharacterized protein n=1 Tax=Candidatus Kentrum sp. LFY TaxID=2126342 RepID=A0A450WTQ6_9GAMM|nr:MAG: Protein of unknown function (DUF2721) [Candidatus Kentron sp. LFY]
MTLGTPALLFGEITLIMLAYTNRFSTLSRLIGEMHAHGTGKNEELERKQIPALRTCLKLIQGMQALGVIGFLLCTISVLSLLRKARGWAR